MRLLAHRGLPESIDGLGKNTMAEYERALQRGLDIEMDIRFHGTDLFCSHDPLDPKRLLEYPTFEAFCELVARYPNDSRVFVNVKCDGQTRYVEEIGTRFGVLARLVTFDHSVPDFLHAEKHFPRVERATRASLYEWALGVKKVAARWVWLDPISMPEPKKMGPFLLGRARLYLAKNPMARIVVVSPDVHLKDPAQFDLVNMPGFAWEIARVPIYGILTDRPTLFGFKP